MRFDPKGLPVLGGVILIVGNCVAQFFPALAILATTNLLFHLGLVVGLLGLLIGDAIQPAALLTDTHSTYSEKE